VTAGQETVAIRMSAHPVFAAVAGVFARPIAAPSANRFGRISPTTADDVLEELGGRIEVVVDGGPCPHGIESTIVLPCDGGVEILRHGPVGAEELGGFGPLLERVGGPVVPGMGKSHYAPATPLSVREAGWVPPRGARVGLLQWGRSAGAAEFSEVVALSPSGDLREAAAALYRSLRRLDAAGLEAIVCDPLPEVGLGVAMMDRLRKAAARE
jgi:L-threonylcarbamoyladenylate synthase